jgi:hypothetical protein
MSELEEPKFKAGDRVRVRANAPAGLSYFGGRQGTLVPNEGPSRTWVIQLDETPSANAVDIEAFDLNIELIESSQEPQPYVVKDIDLDTFRHELVKELDDNWVVVRDKPPALSLKTLRTLLSEHIESDDVDVVMDLFAQWWDAPHDALTAAVEGQIRAAWCDGERVTRTGTAQFGGRDEYSKGATELIMSQCRRAQLGEEV